MGRWFAGETVDVVITTDGLIQTSHRGVLVASHVRRHPPEGSRRCRGDSPSPIGTSSHGRLSSGPQGRLVGNLSFAAATSRVGNAYRRQQVDVRVVGDTVEISQDGKRLRVHAVKHDPVKAHGAFANPEANRPDQRRQLNPQARVAEEPEPAGRLGTGT